MIKAMPVVTRTMWNCILHKNQIRCLDRASIKAPMWNALMVEQERAHVIGMEFVRGDVPIRARGCEARAARDPGDASRAGGACAD